MAEKAQKGRRLLSIDGGGVRGLSALLIIRDIMRRIQIREGLHSLPRPCDYFDLICGSGTGGLIALMLGRLCLPIDDAIASFKTFAKEVYGEGRKRFSKERFKATVLELASRAIVSRVLDDENARLFDDFAAANNACKVFVCAMFADNLNASSPTLLRTYRARNNTSSNFTIWQAARATMAMPGDFKPATLSGEFGLQHRFIDGGVGSNNPSQLALREAESIFPGDALAVLISVGTGRSEIIADSAHQMAAASDPSALMQRVAVDCERVSDELTGRFSQRPGAYYRCSVIHGTEGVSWVDAKALDTVVTQTSRYLEGLRISAELDSMVESLLDVRARAVLAGHNLISSATIRVLKVVPSATPTFTGRHETLSEMDVYFGAGSSLAATYRKVFVLYGPAGVGKSQCAYKFIEVSQAQDDPRFSHVFLIDASSERSIKADLTDLAISKGLQRSHLEALAWLSGQIDNWLILFDGAIDPTSNLSAYFPSCSHGNILITSRSELFYGEGIGENSASHIDRMEEEDALKLFLKTSRITESMTSRHAASALVKELELSPQAITQAGLYILRLSISIEQYSRLLEDHRSELLAVESIQRGDEYTFI